jgi:hypothetical protein
MTVHVFTTDISDEAYADFLSAMLGTSSRFSLVWRDQLDFNEKASRIREQLRDLEVEVLRTVRWPGTLLLKGAGTATVVLYRCSDRATEVLHKPRRLFGWLTPNYPEDLAFYGSDGSCALATVSHEREAFVLSENALSVVRRFVEPEVEQINGEGLSVVRGVV